MDGLTLRGPDSCWNQAKPYFKLAGALSGNARLNCSHLVPVRPTAQPGLTYVGAWRAKMQGEQKQNVEPAAFGEVQIVLAEKRTALAALRTGIAVFALPLSVLGLLVATSRYYEPGRVLHFLVPLLVLSAVLAAFGAYLIIHSMLRLRHYDRMIQQLKGQYRELAKWI